MGEVRALKFCLIFCDRQFQTIMARNKKKRGVNRRASQNKSPANSVRFSRQRESNITFPVYQPIYKFKRVVQDGGFDITTNGIVPTLGAFQFTLSQVPDYTDFTNLFDVYKVEKIHIKWTPEYTELTDAALVSNAVNVYFNTVIDLTDANSPSSVNEVLQYSTIRSTGITKEHGRAWKPTSVMDSNMPCYCWLTCDNPSVRLNAIKFAIPPTGVAMTFRATVTYFIQFASSR